MTTHSTARGKIAYVKGADGLGGEFGREWFSRTRHADGQWTLRAQCEFDGGVVAARSVSREVVYSTGADFKPIDCYNRLHVDGKFMGAGWMRFSAVEAECETLSAAYGRYSQKIALATPALSLCSHPLSSDAIALSRFDHARGEAIQHQPDYWMTSLEHDGASGPLLGSLPLDIEYCGRETITVPAGTFETDHYRFLISTPTGSSGVEHPTEDIWCMPDDYFFVKATVGGYMSSTFLLVDYSDWA